MSTGWHLDDLRWDRDSQVGIMWYMPEYVDAKIIWVDAQAYSNYTVAMHDVTIINNESHGTLL